MTIEQKIMRNLIYDEDATLGEIEDYFKLKEEQSSNVKGSMKR